VEIDKGQLTIPEVLRHGLTGDLLMFPVPDEHPHIQLRTAENCMDTLLPSRRADYDIASMPDFDPSFALVRLSSIEEARLDANGCITLSEAIREAASIEDELVIIGAGDHLEFWNPEIYDKLKSESSKQSESLFEA
jgi:MraZ protein